jgi:hypothetical protein
VRRRRTLARCERLLRARKFPHVIATLEPQVFLYRDNADFYRILGTACLYAGDFGGASSYLTRANQLKPGRTPILLGLAAVHLRRRELPEALRYWLEILDNDPDNRTAHRGLRVARTTEDSADFVTMAESGQLRRLFPPLGWSLPGWLLPVAVAVVLLGAGGLFLPDLVRQWIDSMSEPRIGFESISARSLPDELIDPLAEGRYTLSEAEGERTIPRIGDLFNDYRDNLAMREVNRIVNSNAGLLVKEQVRHLSTYFAQPTFADFSDNFTYADVVTEPWLYDGCYVRWSGQTSNVTSTGGVTRFQFLVGYEEERVLEGIIVAEYDGLFDFRAGPIELIGRIQYLTDLQLHVTSVRRIEPEGGR